MKNLSSRTYLARKISRLSHLVPRTQLVPLLFCCLSGCATTPAAPGGEESPGATQKAEAAAVSSAAASGNSDLEAQGFVHIGKKLGAAMQEKEAKIEDDAAEPSREAKLNPPASPLTLNQGEDSAKTSPGAKATMRSLDLDDSGEEPASGRTPKSHGGATSGAANLATSDSSFGSKAKIKSLEDGDKALGDRLHSMFGDNNLTAPKMLTDIECQKSVSDFYTRIRRMGNKVITKRLKVGYLIVSDDPDDERFLFLAPVGVLNAPSGSLSESYFRCLDDGSYYDAISVTSR